MHSAYKLNKQGHNSSLDVLFFSYLEQKVVPCPVITFSYWPVQVSQETGQVVWYSHLFQNFPQFIVIPTVKGFGIVNKAEIDIFLETLLLF